MTVMMVRAYEIVNGPMDITVDTNVFSDTNAISSWATDYALKASILELVQGRGDNRFVPKAEANRAESAQMIYNFLGLK